MASKLKPIIQAVFIGAALTSGSVNRRTVQPSEAFPTLTKTIEAQRNLKLHPIECADFYGKNSPNGSCSTSDVPTEQLVKGFQALLEPLAFSPGWREDYETWAGLHQFKGGSKITFGVGITPVKGNQDLEGIASIKKFANFINVTVDQPR